MATSSQAPYFNVQFRLDSGAVAASYKLYTYLAGTLTPAATYTDQAGTVPNANPIILDSHGRCALWRTDGTQYDFQLTDPSDTPVSGQAFDDVLGVPIPSATAYMPLAGGTFTGAVLLAGNATANLNPTPLQQVNTLIPSVAKPASTVTVTDAGGYFAGTNVESVLQEIGPGIPPDQTSNGGKFLQTDGSALSWAEVLSGTLGSSASMTFANGLIVKWGTTASIPVDTSGSTQTFPAAFPNAIYLVLAVPATDNGVSGSANYSWCTHTWTVSSFKINNDAAASTFAWLAIGS